MTNSIRQPILRWSLAIAIGLAVSGGTPALITLGPVALLQPSPAWCLPAGADGADPAGNAYDDAQDLLDEEDYEEAADAFDRVVRNYPKSTIAGDALYWKAFSLYRLEEADQLKAARQVLLGQAKTYPKAATRRDSESLLYRIDGALARQGDSEAATRLAAAGKRMGRDDAAREASRKASRADAEAARARSRAAKGHGPDVGIDMTFDMDDDDMDTEMAALQALMQMNPDRALPILQKVLARREPESTELRSHALFLLAQNPSDEAQASLLDAVRNDPNIEVRKNGVFWLSQIPGDASLEAILELLQSTRTADLQENAVFALSQHDSPRAREALRNLALDPKSSHQVREQSVFWIGQDQSPESLEFLKAIYEKETEGDLKENIVFSISQHQSKASAAWLLGRARDPKESMEVRKNALFWLGQTGTLGATELKEIYRTSNDAEMKQQIIFVASQQSSTAAVDLLLEIARSDPSREMRRQAIFWLGQSGDERAIQYLESLVGE